MQFKQKSFRKIPDTISSLNSAFLIGVPCSLLDDENLKKIGISSDLVDEGFSFLPAVIGKTSNINANGKIIVRRDLPKETVYREFEYTRTEFHGRDNPVEVQGSAWRRYERYPRENFPAPSVNLTVGRVLTDLYFFIEIAQHDELLLHKLNLALELFGEFSIHLIAADGVVSLPTQLRVLNWLVLPSGTMTSQEIKEAVEASLSPRIKKTVLPVITKRLSYIRDHEPDQIAVGVAGYRGYVVHNFNRLGISVLESENPDNATYVFDLANWEVLSRMTKTEIIRDNLALRRIFHDTSWQQNINNLLIKR